MKGTAMIESIPDTIELSQDYLVKYWVGELGVSRDRLEQAIALVGNNSKNLRKLLNDGHRIAIRDGAGVGRQVVRITLQDDGFGVQVPTIRRRTAGFTSCRWITRRPNSSSHFQPASTTRSVTWRNSAS